MFTPKRISKGDTVSLKFQLYENGAVKNISGKTFKFGVKEYAPDLAASMKFSVNGTLDDAANGKFSFALTTTQTNVSAYKGKYEVAMYSGAEKTTLTPQGGVDFEIYDDILDVT